MKRIIIGAISMLTVLSSCDNLLDLQPKSQISQSDYFKTETDLQMFSNTSTITYWINRHTITKATCMYNKTYLMKCLVEPNVSCRHREADGRGATYEK